MSFVHHPDYTNMISDWEMFRSVYRGGTSFIDTYLQQFSSRENAEDFSLRKSITPASAHAKAIIKEITNAIYQRLVDISRIGGPESYVQAVSGARGGVDRTGNTMTGYIGRILLPELLVMGKVGVYIDKPQQPESITLLDKERIYPYLYYYTAESILNWSYDSYGTLNKVLLEDSIPVVNSETGLVEDYTSQYRIVTSYGDFVTVDFYDESQVLLSSHRLDIDRLPFVILEIQESLLTDIASYQIALLNANSSDMAYIHRNNMPIYTEQADLSRANFAKATFDPDSTTSIDNRSERIRIGATYGRRYWKGLERPGFIHPSSEPLEASMEKQKQLLAEMRLLVNLTIQNLTPVRSSEESKKQDDRSLEAGLSAIGLELEYAERYIANVWAAYEGAKSAVIQYPTNYSLKTEEQRYNEAQRLVEVRSTIPSLTFQKEVSKTIVQTLIGHKVPHTTLTNILKEIDSAEIIVTDPETLKSDHEAGFVGTELASLLRGYPEGEVEKAKKDHAERAARIALAQSEAGARGVADMSTNPNAGKEEKALAKDNND